MKLFYNGIIHTMDEIPASEAVLVGDDGRVLAVGDRAALERPEAVRIDLGGADADPRL